MAGRFTIEGIFKGTDRFSGVLGSIEKKTGRFSSGVGTALGSTSGKFERFNASLVATEKRVKSFGEGLMMLGAIGAGVGVAAGASLFSVGKASSKVEDSLAKVATAITPAMGTIQDALAETKAASIAWSKAHVQSADEYLQANYRMASAGLNSVEAIAGTNAALTVATATFGDATTAGNLLATLYNNLGDKSRDATAEFGRLGDVVAKTQAMFQIADLDQLNQGLTYGAPSAKMFGINVAQLATVIGTLNTAGLQGSLAGTSFAATMRQMGKASTELGFRLAKGADGGLDFVGTLGNIEKKFGSFDKMTDANRAAFQKAFGDEGVRGIALMLGATDQLRANVDKVTNSLGAAASAQKTVEGTKSNSLVILGNRIEAIKIALGDALLPALDQVMPRINGVIDTVGKWVDANQGLIGQRFDAFVAKAVPLVERFGDAFVQALPGIVQASTALVGLMSGNSDQFLQNTTLIVTTLGQLAAVGVGVAAVFSGLVHAGLTSLAVVIQGSVGVWNGLIATIGEAASLIGGFFADVGARLDAAQGWGAKAIEIGKAIVMGIVGGLNMLVNLPFVAIDKMAEGIKARLKGVLGISSPSKVFRGYGADTVEGFALGLAPLGKTLEDAVPNKLPARAPVLGVAAAAMPLLAAPGFDPGRLVNARGLGSDASPLGASFAPEPSRGRFAAGVFDSFRPSGEEEAGAGSSSSRRDDTAPALVGLGRDDGLREQLAELVQALKGQAAQVLEVSVKAEQGTDANVKQTGSGSKVPIKVTKSGAPVRAGG